ncbi:hypothetical protein MMC13_001605 [Lambiella insularis]|nr:hypothetical protein [Lambiella insularis]
MALSNNSPSLSKFRALSFDIYGTLIDEYTGIAHHCEALISRLPPSHPARSSRDSLISAFNRIERKNQGANPTLKQSEILKQVYKDLASEWGVKARPEEIEAFGKAVGTAPPFPDTVAAMNELAKHYKLIALSNIDRESITSTLNGPLHGAHFDAVLIAEDIGSYKPDHRNFEYLFKHVEKEFGIGKDEMLHVAQGLTSDHGPAKELGMWSAWISRGREGEKGFDGVGEEMKGKVDFQWRYATLGEMAADGAEAFEGRGKK